MIDTFGLAAAMIMQGKGRKKSLDEPDLVLWAGFIGRVLDALRAGAGRARMGRRPARTAAPHETAECARCTPPPLPGRQEPPAAEPSRPFDFNRDRDRIPT